MSVLDQDLFHGANGTKTQQQRPTHPDLWTLGTDNDNCHMIESSKPLTKYPRNCKCVGLTSENYTK